jgi:hypothetical protein
MNELKKLWNDLPPYVKLGIVGLGGYVAYLKVGGLLSGLKTKALIDKEKVSAKAQGQKPSMGEYDYVVQANVIKNAKGWFDDDEDAVYSALRKIKNDLDYLNLEQAFQDVAQQDLVSYLRDFLSSSELGQCNTILAKNGVKYRI